PRVSFYTKLRGYKLGVLSGADYPDHVERVKCSTASPGCVSSQIVLEAILKRHAQRTRPSATARGAKRLGSRRPTPSPARACGAAPGRPSAERSSARRPLAT